MGLKEQQLHFMAFFDHQTRGFPADFSSSTSGIRSIAIKHGGLIIYESSNSKRKILQILTFSSSFRILGPHFFPHIPAVPWGGDNFMAISRKTPAATRHLPHRRSRQSLGRPGGPVDQGVPGAVWDWDLDAVWPNVLIPVRGLFVGGRMW